MTFYFVALIITYVISIKLFSDRISRQRYMEKHPTIMFIVSIGISVLSSWGLAFMIEYCYSLEFMTWHIFMGWIVLFFSFWVISALVAIFKMQENEKHWDKDSENKKKEQIKESQELHSLLHGIEKDQSMPSKISDKSQKRKKY